ncbi:MAG: SUMF1/EgtB/PvdO family nonheme iron enzyme [Fimbriimonadia bacterium]|nr:SUMF1/EgtB/PvdO family nonheme iron enzyme [Fimbriimonadia bacterium]
MRLLRGGSWNNNNPNNFRCAYRNNNNLNNSNNNVGFRVVFEACLRLGLCLHGVDARSEQRQSNGGSRASPLGGDE